MKAGDTLIDGGNSHYRDAIDLAAEFSATGISFIDVGTSGGVGGLERGYSLMIGGPTDAVNWAVTFSASICTSSKSRKRVRYSNGWRPYV